MAAASAKSKASAKAKSKAKTKAKSSAAKKPAKSAASSGKAAGGKVSGGKLAEGKLSEGMKAPAFRLPRDGGGSVSLADFKGRNLVLYFYPKADTSGCTVEALDFTRLKPKFDKAKTDIVGVSADPVKALDKFRDKHKLKVALGSDETKAALTAYEAWGEKSMYGRKFMGVIRKTVLIAADGTIAKVWPKVSVPGHAEDVLKAAEAL